MTQLLVPDAGEATRCRRAGARIGEVAVTTLMLSSLVILFTSIVARDRSDTVTASVTAQSDLIVTVPGRRSVILAATHGPGGTMSEANKELVRRHFEEIWNNKDLAVADELIAEDYLEHAVAPFGQAEPGRVNGPAAMRQTAQWLLAQFPDLHMTIEAIIAEGDTVAVRVLSEGTNLGPLNGVVPPTGKRFSARQSHWYRVADGKQAEHWATREDLVAMLQLGVVQPPGRPPA
jgi:predicted ester cyclase